jgi:heme-degrading monooxygenase HmoA
MQSHVDDYLKRMLDYIIPEFQAAQGLLAIKILRRRLVGYEEVTTITTWQSGEQMRCFCESTDFTSPGDALLQREPPHVYDLVFDADSDHDA